MSERRLERDVELDASPEQVWEAIATGPGISAWFVPTDVAGEQITQRFGGGADATGRVLASEPGRRFTYGAGETAFEFMVEGRDGGGTVLRFAQNGFTGDNWEAEYDSYGKGWDLFFLNLRSYLAHFAGRPVRNAVAMTFAPGRAADAWPVLHEALGLAGHPAVGDEVTLRPDGPDPISGIVDVASADFLGVRSAHGLHRIGAEGDAGCGVSAYHYFYGEPVDDEKLTVAWQEWLTRLFPAPA